MTKFNKKISYR